MLSKSRECNGSVVECVLKIVGLRFFCAVFASKGYPFKNIFEPRQHHSVAFLSKTRLSLLSTGLTQEDLFGHSYKILTGTYRIKSNKQTNKQTKYLKEFFDSSISTYIASFR